MLKAVYSGSYCTHQCLCQLWPCQTAWNEIFIPGIKGRWWMFHRHSAKFLIRERASQESRHFRSPFVLHEKKNIQRLYLVRSLQKQSETVVFCLHGKKSHGDDVTMSTHKLVQTWISPGAAPRCDAKQQSATSFWSCLAAVCSKSPTWWQDFSASHFWDVSRFYMDVHHTRFQPNTQRESCQIISKIQSKQTPKTSFEKVATKTVG